MSDSTIIQIASDAMASVIAIVGFLTLWAKLKYAGSKAEKASTNAELAAAKVDAKSKILETKLDNNTALTAKIERQTNGALDGKLEELAIHASKIASLETSMDVMKTAIDTLSRNLDSTRHELRGQLQNVVSGIQLLSIRPQSAPQEKPIV